MVKVYAILKKYINGKESRKANQIYIIALLKTFGSNVNMNRIYLSDIVGTSVVAPNFCVSQVSEGNHVSANPMLPLTTGYNIVFSSVVSNKSESDPVVNYSDLYGLLRQQLEKSQHPDTQEDIDSLSTQIDTSTNTLRAGIKKLTPGLHVDLEQTCKSQTCGTKRRHDDPDSDHYEGEKDKFKNVLYEFGIYEVLQNSNYV
ncbi:hypothetical protein Tco_1469748 [Tanacetum coccineum]